MHRERQTDILICLKQDEKKSITVLDYKLDLSVEIWGNRKKDGLLVVLEILLDQVSGASSRNGRCGSSAKPEEKERQWKKAEGGWEKDELECENVASGGLRYSLAYCHRGRTELTPCGM